MNQNVCLSLGQKLAADVLALEAMLASGEEPTAFLVMSLRKKVRVRAADLQAAYAEPQPIAPWSYWNGSEK